MQKGHFPSCAPLFSGQFWSCVADASDRGPRLRQNDEDSESRTLLFSQFSWWKAAHWAGVGTIYWVYEFGKRQPLPQRFFSVCPHRLSLNNCTASRFWATMSLFQIQCTLKLNNCLIFSKSLPTPSALIPTNWPESRLVDTTLCVLTLLTWS